VAGKTTDLGTIELEDALWLAGIVVDPDGRPLEGIHLSGPTRPTTQFPKREGNKNTNSTYLTTDATGRFRFPATSATAKSWISASDRRRKATADSRPRVVGAGISQYFGPFTAPDENLRLVFERQPEVVVELIDPFSGQILTTGQINGYCMTNGRANPIGSFHEMDPSDSRYHIFAVPTDELVLVAFSAAGEFGLTVKKYVIPKGEQVVHVRMVAESNLVVKMSVVDSNGAPMVFFPIVCKYLPPDMPIPRSISKSTGFDGNVEFTSLGRNLTFEVNDDSFEPWTTTVTVPTQEFVNLGTITLKRK
jgi:hypothetical protein